MKAKEWLLFAVFVVFVFFQIILSLRMVEYMKDITEVIESGAFEMSSLLYFGSFMLLCALGSVVCAAIASVCLSCISAAVIMRLRDATFEKIMSFSMTEMSGFSSSSLITRCTNDIMQIQNFSTVGLQILVQGPITAVFAISKMGGNLTWLGVVAIVVAIIILVHIIVIIAALPKSLRLQKLVDNVNRVTSEHLTGLRVVHAYNGYDFQKKQFDSVNDELTRSNLFVNRATGILSPFLTLVINGLSLMIYILGAVMINGSAQAEKLPLFSQMIVFSSYTLQAMAAFVMMLLAVIVLPRVIVSLRRISEVLDTEVNIRDGRHEVGANGLVGSIEFRDVSFAYPGAAGNALSHISFKVERAQTLAIIGPTGSGKTTLINLIPRLYDATEGQVLVDGLDVRSYMLRTQHKSLSDSVWAV